MKIISRFCQSLVLLCLALSLNACFIRPYKFDVKQGNVITSEKVAQIEIGMTEDQVHYILGTAMLQDVFHGNRWDYIYFNKPGYGEITRRHFAVYFSDGRVERVMDEPLAPVGFVY